jgi:voltage-gated potassium channel
MSQKLKKRFDEVLDKAKEGDKASRIFDISIMSLIVLNVVAVMLETVPTLSSNTRTFLYRFEVFSVTVFTIEYILRIWSCNVDEGFEHPIKGRLRFAVTPLALIDLIAILPFYLPSSR